MNNSASLFVLSLQLFFHVFDFSFTALSTASISAEIWSGDVPRILRALTSFTPRWLLPLGLCSSVPFFALPSFSFLDHGTFQNCCCLFNFGQPSFLWEEHEDERETRCMVSELKKSCHPMGEKFILIFITVMFISKRHEFKNLFLHVSLHLFVHSALSVCIVQDLGY